jgi:hypothetical protein
VIVELSSDRTEAIDRREKLPVYGGIPRLGGHLIVARQLRDVTVHHRTTAAPVRRTDAQGLDSVQIDCLDAFAVTLNAI